MSAQPRVLETVSRFAPFGVRLWDVVLARPVSEDIRVTLVPVGNPNRRIAAQRNSGGVFFAQDLPGLRDVEFSGALSPVAERPFRVEVADRSGRFHNVSFDARLPYVGLFEALCGSPPSPPDSLFDVVPLLSLPSRPVPPGYAAVRARLVHPDGTPAWLAAVDVAARPSDPLVRGFADLRGEVTVHMPYPEPAGSSGSPPFEPGGKLSDQSWDVEISVSLPAAEPEGDYPDLCAFALRRPATATAGAAPLSTVQALKFGRDLVLPELVVAPGGSPP